MAKKEGTLMAKSKCPICGKVLKGGDWKFYKNPQGEVQKVCIDSRMCNERKWIKGIKSKEKT